MYGVGVYWVIWGIGAINLSGYEGHEFTNRSSAFRIGCNVI